MTKSQLWFAYGLTIFMLLFGFNFIDYGILQRDYSRALRFTPFDITAFIYITATVLSVRLIMQKTYPKKLPQLIISLILLIPAFIAFRYLLEETLCPILIGRSNYVETTTVEYYIADNFSYALYYMVFGILLFMLDYNMLNNKKVKLLESQNREAQLQYLQTQFNPHFLFNSLNNIYSLVTEKSDNAGEAVMRLSDMTRYLIYNNSNECLLKDELIQVDNYINLQKLRFDYELPIIYELSGNYESKQLPTFTVVTFIENAFKHGDFKEKEKPLFIGVDAGNNQLHIIVKNKIGAYNKDKTSGVGLDNIRKRLAIIYPNQHQLICSVENNIFTVDLTINYN